MSKTVYLVMLDEGEYSDRRVSSMGAFSTREKAEEYCDSLVQKPYSDISQIQPIYEDFLSEKTKAHELFIQNLEKKIAQIQQNIDNPLTKPLKKQKLQENLEEYRRILSCSENHPVPQMTLEQFYGVRNRAVIADRENLLIEEWVLDEGHKVENVR